MLRSALLGGLTLFLSSSLWAQERNIVETAVAAGNFQTLVAAVTAADLAETLSSPGPFTVFAPTDEAFAQLPAGTVEALLNDIPTLTDILLYHVVAGSVKADQVVTLTSANTVLGEPVSITVNSNGVFVNDAQVIVTDILCSNGVIHVIDSVLLPPAGEAPAGDIVDTAVAAGRFDTLVTAVVAAGLADALRGPGPFTVFAPNDEAFAKLPAETLNALLANPDQLAQVLLYHVVSGSYLAADVLSTPALETLEGSFARISANDQGAFIENAKIIATDIQVSNGVIHEIDSVILPPDFFGETYKITVTNLTKGQIFSPPLVVAHSEAIALATPGTAASPGLVALAEDGDVNLLRSEIAGSSEVFDSVAFAGPILPGATQSVTITARNPFRRISVAGMLVVTNDSFFLAELKAPQATFLGKAGLADDNLVYAFAYDAGSEANSERCSQIPAGPCNGAGVRNTDGAEGLITISNGIHGVGDLDPAKYDWRGPVALVRIERQ
ncbi:MAG: fasciclin domain-containing protein [Acidobacteria bacterium]|nr:fasciclin domain-containing protein [Acidobacteriota bacterium]